MAEEEYGADAPVVTRHEYAERLFNNWLEAVETASEEFLTLKGYDVDLGAMSDQELEEFWARIAGVPGLSAALQDHVDRNAVLDPLYYDLTDDVMTPLDLGAELTGIKIKGMWIPMIGGGKVASRLLARLAKVGPVGMGLKWFGRLVNRVVHGPDPLTVGRTAAPVLRSSGFGRVEDIARLGEDIAGGGRGGSISSVMSRTGAGAAGGTIRRIPRVDEGMLAGAQSVVGIGAATVGAAALGQHLGQPNIVTRDELDKEAFDRLSPEAQQAQLDREAEAAEEAEEEAARQTLAPDVESIIQDPSKSGVLKQIYYEGLSEEAAFDRLTNFIAGSGVNVLAESGISLGAALEQQEASKGEGGPLGEMQIYSLLTMEGQDQVRKYVRANWETIDEITSDPLIRAITGPPPARRPGGGSMWSLEESVDRVVEKYISNLAKSADFLLITPEQPAGGGHPIGFITSYDGTVNGGIVSFNDMFAGGKINEMNLLPMLRRARPEQIEFWQQQLYAWGYLENPPTEWGRVTPDANGEMHTLDAAHKWQVATFNEGVKMVRDAQRASPFAHSISLSDLIAADGTPRAERVLDRAIASQMSGESTRATDARLMRDRIVTEAQGRVSNYLEKTGRYLPEGAQYQIQQGLDEVIGGLSAERQETAFGQGGSPYERALAESVLTSLSQRQHGTDEWQDMLTFGTTNRDSSFFDYAARVGAVSTRERQLLASGVIGRENYRDHWREQQDQLRGAEADVAVAALLKFISQGMTGDFSTVTPTDIARGVGTYLHTVGIQQGLDKPMSESDLFEVAHEALMGSRSARFQRDDQMLTDVATGGVEQMGLRGGVAGYEFRDIVDQLNSVQGAGRARVRNY